jgi:hypothetical protein
MRREIRVGPKVPRDLAEEAEAIAPVKPGKRARKVKDMDPPSRAAAAVNLAVQGADYNSIAQIMDYRSATEAKNAVWAAIGDVPADHDDVERMRSLHAQRLDRLLYAVMPAACRPGHPDQFQAHRLAQAVLDRQARLYGFDAAQQVVVYTPTQREIAEYAQHVTSLLRHSAGAIEADIIVDAEVVIDGDGSAPGAA